MRAPVVVMAAVALGICGPVQAQDKTLYVAGYGGSFEQTMRKDVFPAFEKTNGVKIEYVAGNSTDTLAKLQAQKGNQQIDVAIVDDGPAYQAVRSASARTLDQRADVYKDVAPVMQLPVEQGRRPRPRRHRASSTTRRSSTRTSGRRRPRGTTSRIRSSARSSIIPPINNTYGLHALIAEAELGGGGENNIEPGFKAFKDEINPNVLAYEPSPAKMTERFQNGQAVLARLGLGPRQGLRRYRLPRRFRLSEGRRLCARRRRLPGRRLQERAEAQAFIQFMLSPPIQNRDGDRRRLRPRQHDRQAATEIDARRACPMATTSRS